MARCICFELGLYPLGEKKEEALQDCRGAGGSGSFQRCSLALTTDDGRLSERLRTVPCRRQGSWANGRFSSAERALRLSLDIAPDKMQTHYYLANVLFMGAEQLEKKGSVERVKIEAFYREAVSQSREALKIKPDYGVAHMTLGLALKRLGLRTEALVHLERAVLCNPEHGELHFYVGEILAEDGRVGEACSRLEQALLLASANVPWRSKVQTMLIELKKVEPRKKAPNE